MNNEKVFQIDVKKEIDKYFDDSSIPEDGMPKCVILAGGVCAGKTFIRKQQYSSGYVLIDAAEIFLSLSNGEYFEFGEAFEEALEIIGSIVANRAIKERRNIITEIIGASEEDNRKLIDAITQAGYKGETIAVYCDIEGAWERNLNRGDDNISAHYTEPYHLRWILKAVKDNS